MIYTPAADSTYDDAFGFITDPLHPLYNKADPSWDGKWSYQCRRADGGIPSIFRIFCGSPHFFTCFFENRGYIDRK